MLSSKQAAQPNPSCPVPVLSGHHISMEHRLRRKHLLLNPDTHAKKEETNKEKEKKKERKEKERKEEQDPRKLKKEQR